MTVLMFPHMQTGVDIHTIYKDGGADYAQKLKWRAFIEELFVNLCEATWNIYEGVNLEWYSKKKKKKARWTRRK